MSGFDRENQRIGDLPPSLTDFEWLLPSVAALRGKAVASVKVDDFSGMGGLSSASLVKINANYADDTKESFICKSIIPSGTTLSKSLGLPRESFFYKLLAPTLAEQGVPLPVIVYSHGDMVTGTKTIILEDLSIGCLQSGYFFGPGSPLNWGKDLDALVTTKVPVELVARTTFRCAASLHATFWKDESLLKHKWLRGQTWRSGDGEESWMAAQNTAIDRWAERKAKIAAGTCSVVWDPRLLACLEASLAKISWADYQAGVRDTSRPWTLVHGDFHPANILWRWSSPEAQARGDFGSPILLDFELVGLGSGPQDLAQYLISHMEPGARRLHEEALLQDYYAHLTGTGEACMGTKHVDPGSYSYAQCKRDYVEGGTGRWLWFMPVLAHMCPEKMTQYFHDQTLQFLIDHDVTPENVPMPRV